ncbi:MAG: COX15/CtaA family protein [Planctomycetota bacterium]
MTLANTAHTHLESPTGASPADVLRDGVGPGVVTGFAAAVAMWCVWFVTHLPAIRMDSAAAGPFILLAFIATTASLLRGTSRAPLLAGVVAGLTAAAVNLLLLGSNLVETPEGATPEQAAEFAQLRPEAPLIVAGFAALLTLLGAGAGWCAGVTSRQTTRSAGASGRWIARFGIVSCVAIAPLLFIGGLVTSTESGMAVPDWPGTYGTNMFLYPVGLMAHPRIFLEHTHRLFGSLVGLTTLALLVGALATRVGVAAKLMTAFLFLSVCVQGVLGGVRVTENLEVLAMLHGISGQAVFAIAVACAVMLRRGFRDAAPLPSDSKLRRARPFAIATLICLLIQLAFGAMYRHLGSSHALISHVVFSLVVTAVAAITGMSLLAREDEDRRALGESLDKGLKHLGVWIASCVGFQFLLGWLALALVMKAGDRGEVPTADELHVAEPVPLAEALSTTIHQANGALLLALCVAAAMWTVRLARRQGAKRPRAATPA